MSWFERVFGTIDWTPPSWGRRVGQRRLLITLVGLLLLSGLMTYAWQKYDQRIRPPVVVGTVTVPGITPIVDNELKPQPLTIRFRVESDPRIPTIDIDSIANLELLGDTIAAGIKIRPAIDGLWRWTNENELQFQPSTDWPAGQTYEVEYTAAIFGPDLKLKTHTQTFTTKDFSATLSDVAFYQDPVDTNLRKVVATLTFSHPVDAATLNERVQLSMRESGSTIDDAALPINYELTFAPQKRAAYLHSSRINIPPEESFATLRLSPGIAPRSGPSRSADTATETVRIPDIESYFTITETSAFIARDSDNDPVQTISIHFSDRVTTDRLANTIEAYHLPHNYRDSEGRRLYWQSPREVTPAVLRAATKLPITLNPVDDDSATLHSFSVDAANNGVLYLRVKEGLTSDGEFVLSRAYDNVLRIPDYPKETLIAQSGAILPLAGSHRLHFESRGVSTIRVELGRLIESDINHLASQTGGDIKSPYFSNYQFDQDNLSERITRYIDVNSEHPGKASYSSLDLSEFLPDGGYYFVTVQGWNKQRNHVVGSLDRRFVLATDIGLLVKQNVDSTQDVFVHSIETGAPIANASVTLLGKNGLPILEATSSQEGRATLPATRDFAREKSPTAFVVTYNGDSIFMPYGRFGRMLQYSRFDIGGSYVSSIPEAQQVRAQVFSDRGIYRPGDSVKLAAIVKRDDWQTLGNVPLRLNISDPRGQSVFEQRFRLPADGFSEHTFATDPTSATGNYTATLYIVENNNRRRAIGNNAFKVEEFLPDRLRIRTTISGNKPKGWIKPDQISGEVELQNLFGTPAINRRVKGFLDLTPRSLQIGDYPDYIFDDPLRKTGASIRSVHQDLSETTTDTSGRAILALDLDRYDKGIYQLTLQTEGFEEGGGRSVTAVARATMSPLDHLIGYKTDADLSFLRKDSSHAIQLLAVNSDTDSIALDDLTLNTLRYQYVSTLVKQANGTFAYESVRRESVLSTRPFNIEENGSEVELDTHQSGSYALQIKGSDGLIYSKVPFTVSGDSNTAGNLERNAELQLNINGSSFAPGDDIELEITAPYTGTGLITIERDRVFVHKWFTASSTTTVQSIRVPDGLEGNAYVNVAFIREIDSPEIYVSPLSYAVAPFSINRDARTVEIDIDVPDRVKPGDELTINYSTSSKSRLLIYAVDEGILQVARYQAPNPLAFFLKKMALQVSTFQMVDLLLPEFDLVNQSAAPGGGDAFGQAGANLNPFRRKTDAPVAFWSGIVDADDTIKRVTFRIPDYFNGQLRIMAIAVNDHSLGREQASTTVRGPFVISPNVLTAAAPGDEFDVNVGIANNIEVPNAGDDVRVSVEASEHLAIVGQATQSVKIASGSEGRATFRVRALDRLGSASLHFNAELGSTSSSLRSTLSVRPPTARLTKVTTGVADNRNIDLRPGRTLYPQYAATKAAASHSPLIIADGMLDYLDGFPHACAEQIVSKVFPKIGFLGNGDYAIDESKVNAQFDQTVRKLRSRQTAEGGFLFWATSTEPADFASVYILHFLSDATARGLATPRDMLQSGLGFLERFASRDFSTIAEARLRAYALYVLTRNGSVTTNTLTQLHETLQREHADVWRTDLTASYMAATYALLQKKQLAEQLIGDYAFGGGDEMVTDFDTRLGRDAQYVYLVSRHFPDQLSHLSSDRIMKLIQPVMKNRYNTLSSAYTVLALGELTRTVFRQSSNADVSISALTGDQQETFLTAAQFARATIDHAVQSIRFQTSADNPMYYLVSQTGFDRPPLTDAVSDGLEVQRDYLDVNGNEIAAAKIGDDVTVRLRIRSSGPTRSNVALVDLLPGAFEVQVDSVGRDYSGWRADYVDVREDRVVVYGNFGRRMTEIRYQVKVTSSGSFVAPSAFASSMYDPDVHARTAPGRFEVEPL